MKEIRIGSFFSGIGGIELGLMDGFRKQAIHCSVAFHIEKDPYCQQVLKRHFPESTIYPNIEEVSPDEIKRNHPKVNLYCGGWPCQDISTAGKQAGITGSRSGLFFRFWSFVRMGQPDLVFCENVSNLLSGERGQWMSSVLTEISGSGYSAEWTTLSASEVGAPHLRNRFWMVCKKGKEANLADSNQINV